MPYGIEMRFIFRRILGPLVLGWAPNKFVLEAKLAPSEKRLACFPAMDFDRSAISLRLTWKIFH